MKVKMLGLLGALVFAAPVAAIAAPAGGLTAQSAAPAMVTPAVETNAAVDANGPTAKIDKVWWRGRYGCCGFRRFGYGFGFRRFGYGYGFRRPFFYRGFYGYRPFFRRRFFYY